MLWRPITIVRRPGTIMGTAIARLPGIIGTAAVRRLGAATAS